ncbi:hypothetical protein HMI54_007271 [Coelomomyces lativittatus]|nr:hypothetical protein HMI54_007271 [Coelomomyces lativittatus]
MVVDEVGHNIQDLMCDTWMKDNYLLAKADLTPDYPLTLIEELTAGNTLPPVASKKRG